jgi:hypothetical protein
MTWGSFALELRDCNSSRAFCGEHRGNQVPGRSLMRYLTLGAQLGAVFHKRFGGLLKAVDKRWIAR